MKIKVKIQIGAIDHKSDYYPNQDDIMVLSTSDKKLLWQRAINYLPYKEPVAYKLADGAIHLLEWEYEQHVSPKNL